MGLITGSKWTCYIVDWLKRLSTNLAVWEVQPVLLPTTPRWCIRSTEDAKIFLVVRRGWQVRINRRSVTEEVREREVYGDISSEEITSHLISGDLNARTILQHCMFAASILAVKTIKYIQMKVPAFINGKKLFPLIFAVFLLVYHYLITSKILRQCFSKSHQVQHLL